MPSTLATNLVDFHFCRGLSELPERGGTFRRSHHDARYPSVHRPGGCHVTDARNVVPLLVLASPDGCSTGPVEPLSHGAIGQPRHLRDLAMTSTPRLEFEQPLIRHSRRLRHDDARLRLWPLRPRHPPRLSRNAGHPHGGPVSMACAGSRQHHRRPYLPPDQPLVAQRHDLLRADQWPLGRPESDNAGTVKMPTDRGGRRPCDRWRTRTAFERGDVPRGRRRACGSRRSRSPSPHV